MAEPSNEAEQLQQQFNNLTSELSWDVVGALPQGEELRQSCRAVAQQLLGQWREAIYSEQLSRAADLVEQMRTLNSLRQQIGDIVLPTTSMSPTAAIKQAAQQIKAGNADAALMTLATSDASIQAGQLHTLSEAISSRRTDSAALRPSPPPTLMRVLSINLFLSFIGVGLGLYQFWFHTPSAPPPTPTVSVAPTVSATPMATAGVTPSAAPIASRTPTVATTPTVIATSTVTDSGTPTVAITSTVTATSTLSIEIQKHDLYLLGTDTFTITNAPANFDRHKLADWRAEIMANGHSVLPDIKIQLGDPKGSSNQITFRLETINSDKLQEAFRSTAPTSITLTFTGSGLPKSSSEILLTVKQATVAGLPAVQDKQPQISGDLKNFLFSQNNIWPNDVDGHAFALLFESKHIDASKPNPQAESSNAAGYVLLRQGDPVEILATDTTNPGLRLYLVHVAQATSGSTEPTGYIGWVPATFIDEKP